MLLSFRDWVMQVTAISAQSDTLSILLISILVVTTVSSCTELSQEQAQKVNDALKDSLTSTTETWGVDMEITEDGFKKVRVLGSYAATYNTKKLNETRIKGPVTIYVYKTGGAIETTVYSDRAIYKAKEAIFELYGNVRVNTSDNRHLKSEYLKWKQGEDLISTPKFVIITTPSDSIAGTGFEGTTKLTNYTIKEPKGRVIVN
ncbi:LPS export ABC transporter protein LptC [Fodinibius salinus]|uniref:LPS export ABC transporter protein LptC n=1 Tax=Fodinibius salinus TaxID=860790 RepID=A0A5D3YQT6_9BACT|nr:LPS export ABC transporter periplasmic protein LptC [Fodinibius salinus]TYP94921.1 LPS export ABC transporter protein LptC [Fodinibius salinus]